MINQWPIYWRRQEARGFNEEDTKHEMLNRVEEHELKECSIQHRIDTITSDDYEEYLRKEAQSPTAEELVEWDLKMSRVDNE